MGIIRVSKNSNYTVINNTALKDTRLSWKAKGIMAYMLSMPDDWVFHMNELVKHATDGERAFRSGFEELKQFGYITRQPVREGQRIKEWETIVHEIPQDNSLLCCFVHVENEDVQNEDVQNSRLLSTDINQVLNKPNTDIDKVLTDRQTNSQLVSPSFARLVDFVNKNIQPVTEAIGQELGYLLDEYKDVDLILEAFKIAVFKNAKNKYKFVNTVLRNWRNELVTTYEQFTAKEERDERSKHRSQQSGNNEYDGLSL